MTGSGPAPEEPHSSATVLHGNGLNGLNGAVPAGARPAVPQPHGGALRPFPVGNRANPGGRPKGLMARVRAQTRDGTELVDFMLDVLRGKRRAPMRLRMEAAMWLADRGFGKAMQQVEYGNLEGEPLVFRVEYAPEAAEYAPDYPAS